MEVVLSSMFLLLKPDEIFLASLIADDFIPYLTILLLRIS
jgi:hypothetical protein